jgi:hypothetical protein
MTTLPLNRASIKPTAECVPMGGPIWRSAVAAVGAGLTEVSAWIDIGPWGSARVQALVAAIGGVMTVDWSPDDAHGTIIAGGALPAVVAAAYYDSGLLTPPNGEHWVRFTYTQGAGASGAFWMQALVPATSGGGGGGGGGNAASTVFATGTPRAPTNIADNLVHELTDPAGAGMTALTDYTIQQIGGADLCVYVAAAAPAVAVCRRGDHVFNGLPWKYTPPVAGLRLWGVKAVDGTANCDVSCIARNGGAGA